MIASAVAHLARELNQGLKRQLGGGEEWVVLSDLAQPDGTPAPNSNEKLAMFLVSVLQDPVAGRSDRHVTSGAGTAGFGGRAAVSNPALNLNLLVMCAANFSGNNYPEALKLLTHTMAFFQSRPVFDARNTPDLDRGIERLVVTLEDLSVNDLANLWGVLGGRYVPSALYRVRMVTIDGEKLVDQVPLVRQTGVAR